MRNHLTKLDRLLELESDYTQYLNDVGRMLTDDELHEKESLKKELEQMENMLNLFDKSKYDDLIKNQRTQEDIQNAELRKEIVDLAYFWDGKESMKYGNSLLKLLGSEK